MIAIQSCMAIAAIVLMGPGRSRGLTMVTRGLLVFFSVTVLFTLGHVAIVAVSTALLVLARRESTSRGVRVALRVALAVSIVFVLASLRVRFFPLSSTPPFVDLRPPLYVPPHTLALEMFRAHPIVGVGLECFTLAWPLFDDGTRFLAIYRGGYEERLGVPLDTHSTWLGFLAEAGVFGGLVLLGLVGLLVMSRRGLRDKTLLDPLLYFILGISLFLDVLTSRELALILGAVLGLGDGARRSAGSEANPP